MPEPRTGSRGGATFREGNSLSYIVWLEANLYGRLDDEEANVLRVHEGADPIPCSAAVRRLLQ